MKHVVVIATALIASGTVWATDEANHSPIYWIDGISYAQDEHTSGSEYIIKQDHGGIEHEEEQENADAEKGAREIGGGSRIESKTEAGVSFGGAPSGNVNVESRSYIEAKFKWELERIKRMKSKQRIWEGAERQARDEIQTTSSDWKLRFNVKFKNVSTNHVFEYKRGGNSTGLQIVVLPVDNSAEDLRKIPVKPESLDKDCFVLRTNGGVVTLHVEQLIPDMDVKRILRAAEIRGELNKCVTIAFDDQFCLVSTNDTNGLWSYCDASACKVNLIDFRTGCRAKLPIVVDYRGLTYSNILEKASMELPSGKGFGFASSGALDNVFERGFGRFAKDERGVYIILLEMHGKIKDSFSGDELKNKPSSGYDNNDLRFIRVGLEDIYYGLAQYPDSVVSNCFAYIKANSDISDQDLFACAMIAKERRNNQIFGHCLSRMQDVRKFLQDDDDITCAMSLIIEADDVEHLAKLYSLEWGWGNTNRTILGFAAEKGSTNTVEWLLEKAPEDKRPRQTVDGLVNGAKDDDVDRGKTPLYLAGENGHFDVCRYLVSKGADISRKFYVPGKKKKEDVWTKESYIPDDRIRNFIKAQREVCEIEDSWWRSRKPNVPVEDMRRWIDDGVLPNSYLGFHWNLLSWAIELNDVALVKSLIDKGADVNGEYSSTPNDKRTALMLACEVGDTSLVDTLIKKGANLYAHQEDGMSAFHYAIWFEKINCAELLLNRLDIAKCSLVEDDGLYLNLPLYVAKYCDDLTFCKKLKPKVSAMNDASSESFLKFLEFLEKAKGGDARSQNNLGNFYLKVVKADKKAFSWFCEAAKAKLPVANYNLSLCYSHGWGIEKDKDKARECEEAAKELERE